MIFKSEQVSSHWDNWCYYHEGTYYLYYLITEHSPGEGFGVATSCDGVHWEDHGWALRASDKMVTYMGTGAVWKATDFASSGSFICNYSEWRSEHGKETQNILFAWSTDLMHWTKFGDELMFKVDDRWYDRLGRWDCIYPIDREEGGYWGTWTATGKPGTGRDGTVGIGFSDDGIHWQALPAPEVIPPTGESGAFYRFGNRIHAMFGGASSMWAYTAERVEGPYRIAERNPQLLRAGHSYFSRFFPTPDGLLVNHQVMSGKKNQNQRVITYLATFKMAVVDGGGVLRLMYWNGNEALKGHVVALGDEVDFSKGIVAEGELRLPGELRLEIDDFRYAVRVSSKGMVEFVGPDQNVRLQIDRELDFEHAARYRLLARRGMLEFYLNDHHMECWTMGCPDSMKIRCRQDAGGMLWQMK